ncbi:MAG TPA: hypothetical protein VJ953_07065 [Saprospiraceae bacterium]|nr:hypothetical protein [Saprospiraceae bacterium]
MVDQLHQTFIQKLEQHYGSWEKKISRFGTATYGDIAHDLCISASLFSQLIYGSATEGMYVRAIRNVERLAATAALKGKVLALPDPGKAEKQYIPKIGLGFLIGVLLFGVVLVLFTFLFPTSSRERVDTTQNGHPLTAFFDQPFDADFDAPYLNVSEVQSYCPASAYEGTWTLNEPYQLPLPGTKKPGLYYLAKSADIRMKSSKVDTFIAPRGHVLNGYEYLINEIWVDTKQTPLSPKYFDKENKIYTPAFRNLDFSTNPDFKIVATIHSFFIDKFILEGDQIIRLGEPSGRFASDVDEELAATYEIDLKYLLEQVIGNLTKAHCSVAQNPYCDPNRLTAGESVINFDCVYTIQSENLGLGGGYPYTKGYRLEQQSYSDNLICTCDDS